MKSPAVKPAPPAPGARRPWRSAVLAAAAIAFGCAGAARAAEDAARADELVARFAIQPETSTMLCRLRDGRTVPADLRHQVENALSRLDRLGLLPPHALLSRRAIVDVLVAVASFDDGRGAVCSQRQIAARATYSDRHVRDVLAWAASAGILDRWEQYMPASRTPPGALEPVTHDRRTVYVLHLVPRELARGADEELLLELAAAADPPLRLELGPRTTWDGRAVDEEAPPQASPVRAEASAPAPSSGPVKGTPAAGAPAKVLPAELGRLDELLEQLAGVADGVRLDAADIAALAAGNTCKLELPAAEAALEELLAGIRRGSTRPAEDPRVRWSGRALRSRLHTFLVAKRRDLDAAKREAEHRAAKARQSAEWERRAVLAPPAAEELEPELDVDVAPAPSPINALVEHRLAALRAELQFAEPSRREEIRRRLDELERGPP